MTLCQGVHLGNYTMQQIGYKRGLLGEGRGVRVWKRDRGSRERTWRQADRWEQSYESNRKGQREKG